MGVHEPDAPAPWIRQCGKGQILEHARADDEESLATPGVAQFRGGMAEHHLAERSRGAQPSAIGALNARVPCVRRLTGSWLSRRQQAVDFAAGFFNRLARRE